MKLTTKPIYRCKKCLRRIKKDEEFCYYHQPRRGNIEFKCEKCGRISKSFYSILNCKCSNNVQNASR